MSENVAVGGASGGTGGSSNAQLDLARLRDGVRDFACFFFYLEFLQLHEAKATRRQLAFLVDVAALKRRFRHRAPFPGVQIAESSSSESESDSENLEEEKKNAEKTGDDEEPEPQPLEVVVVAEQKAESDGDEPVFELEFCQAALFTASRAVKDGDFDGAAAFIVAEYEIEVDAHAQGATVRQFDDAARRVFRSLEAGAWARFKQTPAHKKCVAMFKRRHGLRGAPRGAAAGDSDDDDVARFSSLTYV